jgi:ribonuclease Z
MPKPRIYSYCSDTKPFAALKTYVEDTTTLYHEATFLNDRKDRAKQTFHSTAADAASLAKEVNVRKLFLGHFSSRYANSDQHIQEARELFQAVYAVQDGTTYEIE